MEQKLVQCCETEIVADACNASYVVSGPMTGLTKTAYNEQTDKQTDGNGNAMTEQFKVENFKANTLQYWHI